MTSTSDPLLVVIAGPPLPVRGELARELAATRRARLVRLEARQSGDTEAEAEVRTALAAGEEVVLEGELPTRAERRWALALAHGLGPPAQPVPMVDEQPLPPAQSEPVQTAPAHSKHVQPVPPETVQEVPAVMVAWLCTRDEAERMVRGRYAARPGYVDAHELRAYEDDMARREEVEDEVPIDSLVVVDGAEPIDQQLAQVLAALPGPLPAEAPAPATPAPPRRVLVVDDDGDLREVLTEVIAEFGHHVESAASGEEALARLERPGPGFDLVIADQRMPGLSGTELIARINQYYPSVRTMLLTGFGDDRTCADALGARAQTVLAKPLRVMDLRRALDEALA